MFSFNKVTLLGKLGGDANIKPVGDFEVAEFSIATTSSIKKENVTQWHKCTAFVKSEWIKKQLFKGNTVLVSGEIRYETYEKDGEKKYITKIMVNDFCFPGKAEKSDQSNQSEPAKVEDDLPF